MNVIVTTVLYYLCHLKNKKGIFFLVRSVFLCDNWLKLLTKRQNKEIQRKTRKKEVQNQSVNKKLKVRFTLFSILSVEVYWSISSTNKYSILQHLDFLVQYEVCKYLDYSVLHLIGLRRDLTEILTLQQRVKFIVKERVYAGLTRNKSEL